MLSHDVCLPLALKIVVCYVRKESGNPYSIRKKLVIRVLRFETGTCFVC